MNNSFARGFNHITNNNVTCTRVVERKRKTLSVVVVVGSVGNSSAAACGKAAGCFLVAKGAPFTAFRMPGRQRRVIGIRIHALECDDAKVMLENEGYMFIDMRSTKEYDGEHITKPARKTVNIPCCSGDEVDGFVREIEKRYRDTAKLLLVCKSGELGVECANILMEMGYKNVHGVQGGYEGWMIKYTTSGRKRMPKGKFVSSGREALKSGLNLDPTVASTYEENWGRPELSIYTGSGLESGQDAGTDQ